MAACATLALCSVGHAQTIYRIVGADGKVTFSDKAPLDLGKASTSNASAMAKAAPVASSDAGLPYDLRQVVNRYPVTLYSGPACVPCNSGRILLQGRGIPFTENTISTAEDGEALKRISGDNSLPFLTIGGQKIKGFSESEWTQFLNAANYPATSSLPANYRSPPPKPLVMAQKPAASPVQSENQASSEEKTAAREPAPTQPAINPSNPVGIKF